MEFVHHDMVEQILERLPVKSLLRFKSVSKKWKSTIESQSFRQEQLICRKQSRGPDVLFIPLTDPFSIPYSVSGTSEIGVDVIDAQRFVFGSSIAYTVNLPRPISRSKICYGSCDGLVCLYNVYGDLLRTRNVVVNPATGWHQSFPLSTVQQLLSRLCMVNCVIKDPSSELGFGKDKFEGTYKSVWLHNSTCEVYDFSTKAWRFVLPASPFGILTRQIPVHIDGSLYWLTNCKETKVLSFDLHTETFQVISKAPFPNAPNYRDVTMCILDNRLCVSKKNWPTQVIWSFDSNNKTWKEMCSIDLTKTVSWFKMEPEFVLRPIAIVEKNKLLLQGYDENDPVVVHDLDTKSCDLLFKPINPVGTVCYFESFSSITPKV